MAKKEMTNEEKAKEAEEVRTSNVKKTLESKLIQNAVGSNLVKSNPHKYSGELGFQSAESVYDSSMSSDDAKKIKEQIYQGKINEGKQLGIAGEPTYTSNYDLSVQLARQLNEVLAIARISELEKSAKDVGAKLSFAVPEELKDYIPQELMQKAVNSEGKVDLKKLDEKEQHAFGFYQILSESYKRACALKTTQANYFADLNDEGMQIANLYKKEEKK
jgi:hypothetical protein